MPDNRNNTPLYDKGYQSKEKKSYEHRGKSFDPLIKLTYKDQLGYMARLQKMYQ